MATVEEITANMRPVTSAERAFAQMVIDSANLRENSYNEEAADKASEEYQARYDKFKLDNPGEIYYGLSPDYKKFYTISLEEACDKVAGPLGRIIYLALDGWWNDTLYWAKQVLDPTGTVAPTLYNCQHGHIWSTGEEPVTNIDTDEDATWPCGLCKTFSEGNSSNE